MKNKWSDSMVTELEKHLSEGWSFNVFAGRVSVNKKTIYSWLAKKPEFKRVRDRFKQQIA